MTTNKPPVSESTPTLLVVDDSPENLAILGELLGASYPVLVANSGRTALRIVASEQKPDLILLDVMMPEMDGFAVFEQLRQNPHTSEIPVIFITSLNAIEDEEHGLAIGAVDYITKPLRPSIVLARVHTQLELKKARDWLKDQNAVLEREVARRMAENQSIQDVSIHALARLAEIRDPETGNHLLRTQEYVRTLALRLRDHPRFASFLTERNIQLLPKSAPLHDIGKVGVPDHILLKPGKLSPEEWVIMKTHAKLGRDAIEQAERDGRRPVEFLTLAKEIAHYHHEKWDGSGYPVGLAGDAIPVSARLMALADVFDALICRRVYKPPMPFDQARELILAGRGGHFDPDVVDAFSAVFDEFIDIAERYDDVHEELVAKEALLQGWTSSRR
ncbi:MAG: two-component system response regulator [Methylococcaceae bacterium]|nr:two-component system response regulator [Methylococcaceae bacterium]